MQLFDQVIVKLLVLLAEGCLDRPVLKEDQLRGEPGNQLDDRLCKLMDHRVHSEIVNHALDIFVGRLYTSHSVVKLAGVDTPAVCNTSFETLNSTGGGNRTPIPGSGIQRTAIVLLP